MQEFWVFGYGSLMWRPGFAYEEAHPALLRGAHRSLCVLSHVHRGQAGRPGLVLGLDAGGSCRGIAFRVGRSAVDGTIAYLRRREQATLVYRESIRPVRLLNGDGPTVPALCFVVDRTHAQYGGRLDFETQLRLVRQGRGQSGYSAEYLDNTVRHLRELGIRDLALERLQRAVRTDLVWRARTGEMSGYRRTRSLSASA